MRVNPRVRYNVPVVVGVMRIGFAHVNPQVLQSLEGLSWVQFAPNVPLLEVNLLVVF